MLVLQLQLGDGSTSRAYSRADKAVQQGVAEVPTAYLIQ